MTKPALRDHRTQTGDSHCLKARSQAFMQRGTNEFRQQVALPLAPASQTDSSPPLSRPARRCLSTRFVCLSIKKCFTRKCLERLACRRQLARSRRNRGSMLNVEVPDIEVLQTPRREEPATLNVSEEGRRTVGRPGHLIFHKNNKCTLAITQTDTCLRRSLTDGEQC